VRDSALTPVTCDFSVHLGITAYAIQTINYPIKQTLAKANLLPFIIGN
jgi:hypothetical protein